MTRLISILVALAAGGDVGLVEHVRGSTRSADAVAYALGELREAIREPGLHFKPPPPFENVVNLDKRLQTLDTPDDDRSLTEENKDLLLDAFVKRTHRRPASVPGRGGRQCRPRRRTHRPGCAHGAGR